MLAALWWTLFTIFGIWGQALVPGVDFFAAGLALSLRWQKSWLTLLLALVWVAIQEGSGGLAFGYGVLWYSMLFALLNTGRWFLDPSSLQFQVIVGAALGIAHFFLLYFMAVLEVRAFPVGRVAMEGLLQSLSYPLVWYTAEHLFPEMLRQDEERA